MCGVLFRRFQSTPAACYSSCFSNNPRLLRRKVEQVHGVRTVRPNRAVAKTQPPRGHREAVGDVEPAGAFVGEGARGLEEPEPLVARAPVGCRFFFAAVRRRAVSSPRPLPRGGATLRTRAADRRGRPRTEAEH